MNIPANYFEIYPTRAVTFDRMVAVVVNHSSRSQTETTIIDMNTGKTLDWGMHRTPAEAFRFADAFIADGGPDFTRQGKRYGRAVTVAYRGK